MTSAATIACRSVDSKSVIKLIAQKDGFALQTLTLGLIGGGSHRVVGRSRHFPRPELPSEAFIQGLKAVYETIFQEVDPQELAAFFREVDATTRTYRSQLLGFQAGYHFISPASSEAHLHEWFTGRPTPNFAPLRAELLRAPLPTTPLEAFQRLNQGPFYKRPQEEFLLLCGVRAWTYNANYTRLVEAKGDLKECYLRLLRVERLPEEERKQRTPLGKMELPPVKLYEDALGYEEVLGLPLSTKLFRDYLMDLPLEDYFATRGALKGSFSAKNAIATVDTLLGLREEEEEKPPVRTYTPAEEWTLAHEAFQSFFPFYAPGAYSVAGRAGQELTKFLRQHEMRGASNELLRDALTGGMAKTIQEAEDLVSLLGARGKWASPASYSNILLPQLREKLSIEETVGLLRQVVEANKPFTATTGAAYVEHADLYKNKPVSWWHPLLKSS